MSRSYSSSARSAGVYRGFTGICAGLGSCTAGETAKGAARKGADTAKKAVKDLKSLIPGPSSAGLSPSLSLKSLPCPRANDPNNTGGPIGVGGGNSLSQTGYMGPCPPSGVHRYYFRLYALDVPALNLKAGAARSEVEAAMKNHIVGAAETMGRYEKQ